VNAASLRRAGSRALIALVATAGIALAAPAARAMNIERVISPSGIEAWLVSDHTLPLIAVEFAFLGSANQDPLDKPGVASMAASLLDEGAGPYDANAFHDRLERKAIELSFHTGRDYMRGAMRTLTENRDEAFDALRLALSEPRFDAAAVERERAQTMARLRRETLNPNDMASRNWWATAFPGHPYGLPVNGTLESVPTITIDDLKSYTRRALARDNVKIAIVGDIDAETAGKLIDRTFGALPEKADLNPVAPAVPQGLGRRVVIPLDVPQAVVNYGGLGIARSDPDFMAAYIVNHILGGGAFSSRLYVEVREKRGLAYGISDSLVWLNHTALLLGHTATRADATGQTIEIIEREIRRIAEEGPTEAEFVKAKTEPHCQPARADADRQSRHRLYRAPRRADRCGDARRRQARGQAAARRRHADHRRRPPQRRLLERERGRRIAGAGRQTRRYAGRSTRTALASRRVLVARVLSAPRAGNVFVNLRCVSRAQRSTKWCAADPGSLRTVAVPDQRCTAPLRCALHRIRDTLR
jgi:zinc protease